MQTHLANRYTRLMMPEKVSENVTEFPPPCCMYSSSPPPPPTPLMPPLPPDPETTALMFSGDASDDEEDVPPLPPRSTLSEDMTCNFTYSCCLENVEAEVKGGRSIMRATPRHPTAENKEMGSKRGRGNRQSYCFLYCLAMVTPLASLFSV
jgi:hypothetical protein